MKNIIANRGTSFLLSKLTVLALLSLLYGFTFAQDVDAKGKVNSLNKTIAVDQDVKGTVNSLFGNLTTLGNVWQVTECCGWTGTRTRRINTNLFDAAWRHTNGTSAVDVIELKTWNLKTNEVILFRKSMNGSYKAFFNASNRTL